MLRIAVVEDNPVDQTLLQGYLERYFREEKPELQYRTAVFESAVSFLGNYRQIYDGYPDAVSERKGCRGKAPPSGQGYPHYFCNQHGAVSRAGL